jgi:serine/threonine protein phosphatase PrpC
MGHALVEAALEGGGKDNISVIVVRTIEAAELPHVTGIQLLAKPETVEMPNMLQIWPKQ